jgi:uncharacterized repeat protein (TIGR01451 family)
MIRTRTRAAMRRTARFFIEQLEDRSVPATFTSAGFTFEQNSTPDVVTALAAGTYDSAVVTGTPSAATGTVSGFPNSITGFNANLSLGSLVTSTGLPKALQLDETTTRSGVQLSWSNTKGLANASGNDLVLYETEPGTTSTAEPEPYMVEVHDATTNTWSAWYYKPASAAQSITIGGSAGVVFATAVDFSDMGVASGDIVDAVRVVNMTSADRMVNSNGIGQVIPEDNGATSSVTPSTGTLGLASTFSPELLYVGAFKTLTNPLVNVSVTKTDNATSVNAGANVSYTIVVDNTGPNAATGTTLTDTLPSALTNVTFTSTVSGGATGNTASGTGNISDTLDLPVGSSVTYTVNGTVSSSAAGTLVNTATATVASSLTDAKVANNSATDTDTIVPKVDLKVTKTDNKTVVAAGQQVGYTVVVSNIGQDAVNGATVVDNVPSALTNVTFTSTAAGGATGNTASGSGNLNETLDLPAGSSVTYTVTGTVASGTTLGTMISNTATVSTPSGTTDNLPGNNAATDTDKVVPLVDLSVTKTDHVTSVSAGQQVTYTIVASNLGASDVTGATLGDVIPSSLTNVTFTSTASGGATGNTASGSGSLNETLDLPVGSSVTYTVTGTVSASATGSLANTATISTPSGTTDNDTSNNTATDTDTISTSGSADLRITNTDGLKFTTDGNVNTYTITVSNVGSADVNGATVTDLVPSKLTNVTWTSVSAGGATGSAGSGSGSINEVVNLPVGSSMVYTLKGTVTGAARGEGNDDKPHDDDHDGRDDRDEFGGRGRLLNVATVTLPAGMTDVNPSDNTATDRDTVLPKGVPPFLRQFSVGSDEGAEGHVKVFNDDGSERFSFFAFPGFNGGVKVATGDVNGDGIPDIVVGSGLGSGNGHVKVFDGATGAEIASFFAFENYRGGVSVAVGDVNGDGFGDIIVGSSTGADHVKVFSLASGTPVLIASFMAYGGFAGGINVAAGDVNGDGLDDIITGVASQGPAHVKVFTIAGGALTTLESFITLPGYTGGISVAAGNLRGDARAEILVAPSAPGGNDLVQMFSIDSTAPIASFTPSFRGADRGLRVAIADVNGDGKNDILVAAGPGHGALVRAYDATTLAPIHDINAFEGFEGGVFVG